MKQISAVLIVAALSVSPAYAEDPKSDLEQGLELLFDGLREEMAPAIIELGDLARQFGPSMRSFFEEMGPALAEMMTEVQDWSRYEMPEMLPNGDIIIRRKPDPAPEEPEAEPQEDTAPDRAIDI
ncbi:hypothetical protein [Falsiphaeobacter marinintestinus]|uniref:hypothetical protein n=1 Tax=Falsiphaeobacter marinintestinus TaxID=1492905 RepID=UPI0011B7C4AA|nr:hypothetical protein [Phaeobacter marinintestinus]